MADDDGDGLVNEDGPNPQIDNDGDRLFSEDPVKGRDDDGDLSTVSILRSLGLNLKGFYHIDRLLFRPRPILPEATVADYLIRHGDPESVKDNVLRLRSNPLVPINLASMSR